MSAIETYVFLDLETSGLPREENNKTKITELSLVAVKRQHILDTRVGCSPRVQHKLTLCFNPGRMIHPDGSKITGLCNDLLEQEPYFNTETYTLISTFLSILTKPVCLIAQNGNCFDFPILKNHLDKISVSLPEDLMCADCYHGFYDILEGRKKLNSASTNEETAKQTNLDTDEIDLSTVNCHSFQEINEKTPKQQIIKCHNETPQKNKSTSVNISKARRRFPWSKGEKPKDKYKLKDIYERLLNRQAVDAHRAENDCLLALECSVAVSQEFVNWVDKNHCLFSQIKPMTIGIPLGM